MRVLMNFYLFILVAEKFIFGHSVAIFSLRLFALPLLKSNLRPSSTNNILRLFVFLVSLKFTFIVFQQKNSSSDARSHRLATERYRFFACRGTSPLALKKYHHRYFFMREPTLPWQYGLEPDGHQ